MTLAQNTFVLCEAMLFLFELAQTMAAQSQLSQTDPPLPPSADRRTWQREQLGCGQMGSTLIGPLQKQWILTDWEKGTPWHCWEDSSKLTGIPNKSLSKSMQFAATPSVASPREESFTILLPERNPLLFYSQRGILYYSTPREESFHQCWPHLSLSEPGRGSNLLSDRLASGFAVQAGLQSPLYYTILYYTIQYNTIPYCTILYSTLL